jgi:hypothetical protein
MYGLSGGMEDRRRCAFALAALLVAALAAAVQAVPAAATAQPEYGKAVAFDVSKPLAELAAGRGAPNVDGAAVGAGLDGLEIHGASFSALKLLAAGADAAAKAAAPAPPPAAIPPPLTNFEGLSNTDNFNVLGFRVNPPDPVGDVGPNHYVEMVNLVFAVYDKAGNLLLGPVDTGTLWAGFLDDCTDPSGDPIVLYDQLVDRWILTQFTTRGLADPALPFYNCVAVSQTGDPTGAYYRYAFKAQADTADGGFFFPDYPKYGVWRDSYVMTTRDFGTNDEYGISVYALEKNRMVAGNPDARAVQFFLDARNVPLNLIGDGLLPPDLDGKSFPAAGGAIPIVGTQDDGAFYGATSDALNIWELNVRWQRTPKATLEFKGSFPVAPFDSIFPCAPSSRDCLPQPGIVNPAQYLDILSYRQRPMHRLAFRNAGHYETMVTNQSVEAAPGVAGVAWWEIRRVGGAYSVYQQGVYAPGDGVHRWMGSAAMDRAGNIALGYSVVNGVDVFPGIRYTARLAGDPLGSMGSLGEGTVINGSGVQTTTNSRWGDYTSLNVDPVNDCTFWYVNEYYTAAGQASSPAGWQTRIASFRLPGC